MSPLHRNCEKSLKKSTMFTSQCTVKAEENSNRFNNIVVLSKNILEESDFVRQISKAFNPMSSVLFEIFFKGKICKIG